MSLLKWKPGSVFKNASAIIKEFILATREHSRLGWHRVLERWKHERGGYSCWLGEEWTCLYNCMYFFTATNHYLSVETI